MATIHSLGPSISQLSLEEVYTLLSSIRASRRRKREDTLKPKVVRTSKVTKKQDLTTLSKTLTQEQKLKIAEMLLKLT